MKSYGIIYKTTNLINKKIYIGQTTVPLEERKEKHFNESKRYKNILFYKAIKKYGIENFKWEVLIECSSRAVLNEMETLMIIEHVSHKMFKKGYNMTWGGDGASGYKHSEESKKKMSEAKKGIKLSEEHKRKIGISSEYRKRTKESIIKMIKTKKEKNIKHSNESKIKMSKNHANVSGNKNPMYGKKHKQETIQKIKEKRAMQKSPMYGKNINKKKDKK